MKISVVIAAYQEPKNIGPLTERLIATLDGIAPQSWELVYVIDGTDETADIARGFFQKRNQIRILHQAEPQGLGHAFRRGFAAIAPNADFVVTMDADLNHQPEEIQRLIGVLKYRNADLVIGSRKLDGSANQGTPLWKRLLSEAGNLSMRLVMNLPVSDRTSGFRVYRAAVIRRIAFRNDGFAFLPEILMRAHACGFRMVEAPIQFVFRKEGESKMKIFATARSYLALLASRRTFAADAANTTPPKPRRIS
jgi:dolichol-phosphate mannosyltransferase